MQLCMEATVRSKKHKTVNSAALFAHTPSGMAACKAVHSQDVERAVNEVAPAGPGIPLAASSNAPVKTMPPGRWFRQDGV